MSRTPRRSGRLGDPSRPARCSVLGEPRLGMLGARVLAVLARQQDAGHTHDPHRGLVVLSRPRGRDQPVETQDVRRSRAGHDRLQPRGGPRQALVVCLLAPERQGGEARKRAVVDDVEDHDAVRPHVQLARAFRRRGSHRAAPTVGRRAVVGRHPVSDGDLSGHRGADPGRDELMRSKLARCRPPGRLAGLVHRIEEMTVEGAGLVLSLLPSRDHASQRLVGWKLAPGRATRRPQLSDELRLAPAASRSRLAKRGHRTIPRRAVHFTRASRNGCHCSRRQAES